jgi:transposase
MVVDVGVDPHKKSLTAAVVDGLGRVLETREFPNDSSGHSRVVKWVNLRGDVRRIGIEGSGGLGAGLARKLVEAGFDVREVPASLAERARRRKPSQGKSDAVDAAAIARVVAREDQLPSVGVEGAFEDLKLLVDYRDQLKCTRTQITNRVHAALVFMFPGYQKTVPNLVAKKHQASALRIVRRDQSVRAQLTREMIAELRRIDEKVSALEQQIKVAVIASGTTLVNETGISWLTAAKILGEVGSRRIRSKAAFAMINGTAPLIASSGGTSRHRLNRGGNRQLNYAIHTVALSRAKTHSESKAYLQKQRARGRTKKESMRCLKRHISNLIYRQLPPDCRGAEIAA